ncbi:helix-turn-helix domain-containing protein [Leucobacter chromiiresistens]|uniref:helix-turn-helix domain-containing protein n=1 Tax=Leucobacter chromiiresistens TaxID=1079994 RepID=UPI00115FDA28
MSGSAPDAAVALRGLREAAGMSVAQLSAVSDVSVPFIRVIESGGLTPTHGVIARMAAAIVRFMMEGNRA